MEEKKKPMYLTVVQMKKDFSVTHPRPPSLAHIKSAMIDEIFWNKNFEKFFSAKTVIINDVPKQ